MTGWVDYQYYVWGSSNADYNYSALSGDVYIASYVQGVGIITQIGAYAFAHKKDGGMFNVILPSTIQEIRGAAFLRATKLYSIQMNEGLTTIGNNVFYECTDLTSVYIPTSLKEIPKGTFEKCTSLPAVALSAGIEHIGEAAFRGCTALQSVKSQSGVNNVKTIGNLAFYNCTSLSEIRFSNGLTSIGEYAFSGCSKLENVNLPAKVSTIGQFAFANSGLKTLTVNWTTPLVIQANVFDGVNLSKCTLYVPVGSKEAYKNDAVWKKFGHILEIGETPNPEEEVEPIEPITTGQQQIGGLWYNLHEDLTATLLKHDDNENLTGAITIPASVTYGAYTYSVKEMQENVFYQCAELTDVTLPNTITEIPAEAFRYCTGLTKVTLPAALTTIGKTAFNGCTALQNIALPASLTEIGGYAFGGCESLTSVTIPSGVKIVSAGSFYHCFKLAKVILPEGVKEIGDQAFAGCYALTTLTLPASLKSLGLLVFYGNAEMVSLRSLSQIVPTAENTTFNSMPVSTCILYVPQGTKDAYAAAEGWGNFTNIQEKGVNEKIKYGPLYYQLEEDGTAYVTFETEDENNYKDLSGEITVQDKITYKGFEYKVNKIGENALRNCKGITKVNLPLIMDYIRGYAFSGCSNLAQINIPTTVRFLMNTAFEGTQLFNDNIDADGAVYYDGCMLCGPDKAYAGAYTVKEGTRLLASNVFANRGEITSLTVPEGVQCICNLAVYWMDKLQTLSLPSTLYSVGTHFGYHCSALNTIYNYSETPVELPANAFSLLYKNNCTLYVPYGCKDAYSAANIWKDFPILEMDPIYTVTFEDYNGFELSSEQVKKGGAATAPAEPTREGYHFTGWDKKFDNVQSDLTVKAIYAINAYTVTFRDMNPSVILKTESVNYGDGATAPDYPEHTGYHFLYWTPEYDIITSDLDVYAHYAVNTYTVTFLDWDDTVLKTEQVEHGNDATAPVDPTREGYTFTGWSSPLTNITADLNVYAQYEENKVYFTVTYFDWNMTILGSEQVEEGQDAKGLETDPEREGYTFTGWSSPLTNITSDLNVQAQYEKKEPTALDDTDQENPAARPAKHFRNGILYINRNGILYDAAGNQVQ